MQLSSCAIRASTPDPTPLPKQTHKFCFTSPPDAAAQAKGMGLQFNLLSRKHWVQPVLYFIENPLPGWPKGVAYNADVSGADEVLMFPGTSVAYYNVGVTTNQGYDVGVPTNVALQDFFAGKVYALFELAGSIFTISLHDAATDAVIYSQDFDFGNDPPYHLSVELVGKYQGEKVDFQSVNGSLSIDYASGTCSVQVSPSAQVQWGTKNGVKVVWNNETIEASNLYTSIVSQTPEHTVLAFSPVPAAPPVPTDQSFTAQNIAQSTFAGRPAVKATVTNNLQIPFTAVVLATLTGSGVMPSATISALAPGSSTDVFLSLAGLTPGMYTLTFVVYSMQGVPLSTPYSIDVSV